MYLFINIFKFINWIFSPLYVKYGESMQSALCVRAKRSPTTAPVQPRAAVYPFQCPKGSLPRQWLQPFILRYHGKKYFACFGLPPWIFRKTTIIYLYIYITYIFIYNIRILYLYIIYIFGIWVVESQTRGLPWFRIGLGGKVSICPRQHGLNNIIIYIPLWNNTDEYNENNRISKWHGISR